jgi:hypothetical protein
VRRSAGGTHDVAGLLAGLPSILTDDAPGTFSAVPRVQAPSRAGERRRRVERLVSDETIARLPELDVEELTRAVEVLGEEEKVSTHRRAVQRVVVDLLRGELARRYRDGTAQVSQLLELSPRSARRTQVRPAPVRWVQSRSDCASLPRAGDGSWPRWS